MDINWAFFLRGLLATVVSSLTVGLEGNFFCKNKNVSAGYSISHGVVNLSKL